MLDSGVWVKLAGDPAALRELAMAFNAPHLRLVTDAGAFYLGSTEFSSDATTDAIRRRAARLLAMASGSCALEFGSFSPPQIDAVTRVDENGRKEDLRPVGVSARMPFDVNALQERERDDGMIEVVEVGPPPSTYREWVDAAQTDDDIADVLAILGREDVRWHDLWHVYELVKLDVGKRMFSDGWVSKADEKRFTQTANSRRAIGHEARHSDDRVKPPKRPMEFAEAKKFAHVLARRWLDLKVPPALPRVIRVVEVRAPAATAET
jgi:hypothetical protein